MNIAHFNEVGVVFVMKCCFYTKIKRKEKIMVAKCDFIEEHASKKKGSNGKLIMDPKCMHVK